MRTFSVFISSDSMRGTHLAQTFRTQRTPIMWPTLSLKIPNETAIFFDWYGDFHGSILQRDLDVAEHLQSQAFHFVFWHSICLHQFSIFETPYPASYCTHINTLHLNQRLTVLTSTHFTLPSVLLYSHQHTSPYPASYCTHINTLHLTQRLTVLTSTNFTLPSALLYSHPHTSPYPAPYCTHINTLITISGLHSSVNFNWNNFFLS